MSTIKNKSMQISRVPLSRMLKSEMADYAERTAQIVNEYDPESALITEVFGLLEAQQPQIELLRISYGIDTQRLKVEHLKTHMLHRIENLKTKVKVLKSSGKGLDPSIVDNVIGSYLNKLHKTKNEKELLQKVQGFLDEMDANEVTYDAFMEFELMPEIDAIKMAHSDVNLANKKRVNLLSKRSKEPTKNIMRGLHDTVNNLFKAIEVSHLVGYPLTSEEGNIESDFTEMINELSQLSDMYNRSIAIRVANNQRKLDRKKELEEGKENLEDTEDNEGNEPVTTAMYCVNDEETDEFADEEMAPFSTMSDPLDEDKEDAADYE